MTENAKNAIRAARNRANWGRYATDKFVINHNIPSSLYDLAIYCEAMSYVTEYKYVL